MTLKDRRTLQRMARFVGVGLLALSVAACAPRVAVRGNLPDPDLMAEVEPGHSTRDDVAEIMGAPSTVAPFEGDTWYYISERTETVAFLEPKVVERTVIVVRFDGDTVRAIETFGLDEGQRIQPIDRATPTAGHEMGIIEQLFGNLGRFNK